jgi:dihydroflavonol-4-reductase
MSAGASLVTGGAGFIGRHLVHALAERGERVRVLDIRDDAELPRAVEYQRGSITDADAVDRALDGMDRLYHLAADPNLWLPDKSRFREVNLMGTRIVLDTAARHNLERIVYTSTESILRGHHDGATTNESMSARLADMPGPYCKSKFLAEHEAVAAAERGLPVVIVNPTLPVGPGDHNLTPPTRMLVQFLRREAPAYLDFQINMVDVRDLAVGHILAAEKGRIGERYILGGENLRLNQLLAILEALSGVAMPKVSLPYWLAWATGAISELTADLLTHKRPIAPFSGVRLAGTATAFDCSKARRELDPPHRPIRDSLADAITWLAEEGHWRSATDRNALTSKSA